MRLEHAGGAKKTTSTVEASDTALIIEGADLSGWPTGAVGPFYGCMNKGKLLEEKILFASRSGNTLQVWTGTGGNGRGADGTVAQTHPINSTLEHVWTADEADDANAHQESTTGAHGMPDPLTIVTLAGAQTITGVKTLQTPVIEGGTQDAPVVTGPTITGGEHTAAVKMSVAGAQAEAEFRVRNTYIGTGVPDDALGSNGDIYIQKA